MKTSARNQFQGTVRNVKHGAVNDEIEIETDDGARLVATVTAESRATLGLEAGAKAFALIKASSIVLVTGLGGARLSARNQLAGRVAAVTRGAVNGEVVLDLPGGGRIAAIVTQASLDALDLQVGGEATALFKASSVIVGVDAA